ncbi:MAG: hypothetical protein GMKNLPBB_00825 [Myxococcota bacterium]|nr:hypothetical protein [Myxococcota bacterium]
MDNTDEATLQWDRDAIAGRAGRCLHEAAQARDPHLERWRRNLEFYEGRQWPEDAAPAARPGQNTPPRITANLVMPIVEHYKARLLSARPVVRVAPATADEEDQRAARACDALIEALWRKLGLHGVIETALGWAFKTGTGIIKAGWDPHAGDPEPEDGASGSGMERRAGEVSVEALSPFDFLVDPQASDLRGARYAIHARAMPAAEAFMRYPAAFDQAPGDGDDAAVMAVELWERPSPQFPCGLRAITVDGRAAEWGPNPFMDRDLPFVIFSDLRVEHGFWGQAVIDHVIPLQRAYNGALTRIHEHHRLTMNGKWLVPREAGVGLDKITSAPGEILHYSGGFTPSVLYPPPLAESIWRQIEEHRRCIRDISGVHEVSEGEISAGVTAWRALAALQEADSSRFSPVRRRFEQSIAALGRLMLLRAQQFYTAPRVLRVVGRGMAVETIAFNAADIPAQIDVVAEAGSGLGASNVSRAQTLMELERAGMSGTPAGDLAARLLNQPPEHRGPAPRASNG